LPCVDDSSTLRDNVSWRWGALSPHLVSASTTHGALPRYRAELHAAAATRDFTSALGGGTPHLVASGHTIKLHDAPPRALACAQDDYAEFTSA
jgi:hypothetical protein